MLIQMDMSFAEVKNFLLSMAILDASSLTTVSLTMDQNLGFHFCILSSVKVCFNLFCNTAVGRTEIIYSARRHYGTVCTAITFYATINLLNLAYSIVVKLASEHEERLRIERQIVTD
jgi:hypothetical protein